MPVCPACGSTDLGGGDAVCLDCGSRFDEESQIASWLGSPNEAARGQAASPEPVCTACGYAGDMIIDDDRGGTSCPACLVVIPPRRTEAALKVARVIECPECGQSIGLVKEDAGKTVVCPGCSCFLGTFGVGARDRGRDGQPDR